jgi:tetratricopeptide (TPR) repeat protein
VAVSYNRIGDIWDTKGDYDKALGYFEKNLAINLEYYGESHPNVAVSYNRIGDIWDTKGDYDKALGYFEKNLAINLEYYGESHPNVSGVFNNFGLLYMKIKRFSDALKAFNKALAIDLLFYQETHPTIGSLKKNLAHAMIERQQYADADILLKESIDVLSHSGIPYDPRLGKAYQYRAKMNRYLGRLPEAVAAIEEAISVFLEKNGETHINTADAWLEKARILQAAGNAGDAELCLARCYAIRLQRLGPQHPDTLEAAAGLR